ncbi:MAG: DUF5011 domain-containing protein, partial [Oscillospiraceae bacterium]|nr:DUF5011 domain-containing protein [Oscillospiraceae bacterium]
KAGTYIIVVRTSDGALATTNLIISSGTTPATPPTHTTITLWGVATTGNVNDTIYTSADITSPIPINASTFSVICSDPTAVKFGTLQFSSGTVSYHTIVSIPINCIKAGTYTLTASTTDGAAQTETLTISNGSSTPANNYYNTPQQSQTPADYLKGTINAWLIAVSGYAGAITSQCQAVLNQSSSTSGTPSDSDAINSLVSQMQMDVTGATSDVNYYCSKALVALFSTVAASDNIDLSNIDVSNEISAATTIIKDVGKAFKTAPFKQKYGPNDRYIIEIQMTSFDMGWNVFGLGNAGAFYGSIYCTDSTIYDFSTGSSYVYKGAFGSNINQTENAIKDFMGQLNQLANNADNNAVSTVISSLAGYTGMGTLATSAITPLINSKLEALKFGNVSKTLQSISDYYSYVAKVLSPPSDSSILQYAQDITSQANSLAFNDPSGITIPTILNAYDQLNNATQTVYKAAADYINGQTPAPDPNKPKTSVSDSIWSGIKSSLKCPVDIAVYDQSGTEVGYVTGNNVSYSSGIYIEKDGDVKTVYSDAGENITIKAIGTAYGTMDYTIEEYVSGQPTSRLNFYDIRIGVGTTIIANVPTNPLAQVKDTFTLTGDDGTIKPDEYYAVTDDAMVTINTTATAGGTVYSSRTAYTKGDLVRLTALTSPGYIFIGWYNGNQWVSNYAFYEFSARENMNLTANFVDLNLDSTTSGTNLITVIPPTTPNVITITDPFVYAATFDNTPVGATLGTDTDSSTQTVDKTQADAVIYAQDKTLNVGDPFVFMNGVTAKDNGGKGKDITKKVRLSGVINTKVPGKYTMHYSVKGKNGNVVSKDVTITVK